MPRPVRYLLFAAVPIAVIALANLGAACFISARLGPTIDQFRHSRPAAYMYSPFYRSAFIDEQTALSMSWRQADTLSGWDSDFHGRYFNTDHGIRRTAFQPAAAPHTVWMLGNSTLFDYETPDDLTISSQLQRLLNAAYGPHYRVVNLGQSGLGAAQNLSLLKRLPIQSGDVVIEYDGLSEAFALRLSEETRRNASAEGKFCNSLTSGPFGSWTLVNLYCLYADANVPAVLTTDARPTLERTAQQFQDDLIETYQVTTGRGADYYHFLPPHIWSKSPSTYESFILGDPYLTPPGTADSFALMWPALQAVRARVAKAGVHSYDLTHILDWARTDGQELYLDFVHINEQGDSIIAQTIVETISTF